MKRFTLMLLLLFVFCLFSLPAPAWEECAEKENEPELLSNKNRTWEDSLKVPDEVLSLPTDELLDYFLNSEFLLIDTVGRSGPIAEETQIDYSIHPAYSELIKRPDFAVAIGNKASEISKDTTGVLTKALFAHLLSQHDTIEIIKQNPEIYEYIQKTFYNDAETETKGPNDPGKTGNSLTLK